MKIRIHFHQIRNTCIALYSGETSRVIAYTILVSIPFNTCLFAIHIVLQREMDSIAFQTADSYEFQPTSWVATRKQLFRLPNEYSAIVSN